MKCPKCDFENVSNARFCSKCGTYLNPGATPQSVYARNDYDKADKVFLESLQDYEVLPFSKNYMAPLGIVIFAAQNLIFVLFYLLIAYLISAASYMPNYSVINTFSGLLGSIACIGILCLIFRRQLKSILYEFKDKSIYSFGGKMVLIMYCSVLVYSVILQVLKIESTSANQNSINLMTLETPFMSFLYVCLVAPIIEELIFRFCIFRGLTAINEKVAMVLTVALFAGIHMISSISAGTLVADLTSLPVYLIGSIALTYTYYKKKKIASSIFAHMLYNTVSFVLSLVLTIII